MKTLVKGKDGFNPYADLPTIVAVDYDGVIYSHDGVIVPEVVRMLRVFSDMGIEIIIWTCRDEKTLTGALGVLDAAGVNVVAVNANHPLLVEKYEVESRKVFAHRYIDDQMVGWSRLSWNDILVDVLSYHLERVSKGEVVLNQNTVKRTEIQEVKAILRDFEISVSKEEEAKWKTMTSIQLRNHMKTLIKRKMGWD